MSSHIWNITSQNGFLTPQTPTTVCESFATQLNSTDREKIEALLQLPYISADMNVIHDLPIIPNDTVHLLKDDYKQWLFTIYGYAMCAWVHGGGHQTVPDNLSQSLDALSGERPPMLSYAEMVLYNWQLKDVSSGFTPKNVDIILRFTDLIDESWFFRVHIAIEAQAGPMLQALVDVQDAIDMQADQTVLEHLRTMQRGLVQITRTFHEMPKLCDPDIYFQSVRPYLMSIDETVIFEGIDPNPTPLRGGSGAQSSIVPAMLAGLGIAHRESELTSNLSDMRRYMPKPHRDFIANLHTSQLRDYCASYAPLRDAYNAVLKHLVTFRRAHLYYARTYIFEKSTNPVGTGGTEYMSFLTQLIDETKSQLL